MFGYIGYHLGPDRLAYVWLHTKHKRSGPKYNKTTKNDRNVYRPFSYFCPFPFSDHYPEHIEQLVQQCMEWCDSYNLPLVVPLSSWLPDPRIPLVQSIDCPEDITKLCPTRNGQHLFCATTKNDVHMYHVPSKKLIKSMTGLSIRLSVCLFVLSPILSCYLREAPQHVAI